MKARTGGLVLLALLAISPRPASAQGRLETALADLYATCLFDVPSIENNPFSEAASMARESFAPGLSGFIESSLAAIPLTPPSLEAEYTGGEIVNVVTGFSPIYTETSATVGSGLFLGGTSMSHFSLSEIRGETLDGLEFAFEQNGGGDAVLVNMPFDVNATVFTVHGTYGVTNRFDVGIAIPVVRLSIENTNTTFQVTGSKSGCRYPDPASGVTSLNCEGRGSDTVSPALYQFSGSDSEIENFVGTLALRAKYRFPVSAETGRLAAVLSVRIPTRSEESMLGTGNFGTRLTFVGEYRNLETFSPYVNVGARFWNGQNSNTLMITTGFNQLLARNFFLTFDVLGELELEPDPFLAPIDRPPTDASPLTGSVLTRSTIPSIGRDHTLNAGLGFQLAISPSIHAYASALFSLVDRGLQSELAPTVGVAAHF